MNGILIPWVVASTILLFVAAYWIYTLESRFRALEGRYKKILALAEEADEVTIANLLAQLADQEKRLNRVEGWLGHTEAVLPHTIQGCSTVRYNAFPDVGGEQSFSLALVDERGNGVMISSLHGRTDTRIYAKPLKEWRSPHSLSAEEQDALGQARRLTEGGLPPQSS